MKEQADLVDRRNILAALNLGLIDAERTMSLLDEQTFDLLPSGPNVKRTLAS